MLEQEFKKDYFIKLGVFVKNEYKHKIIYPQYKDIFNAFRYTDYDEVKVVILGQDPYHGDKEAHGLSFSVQEGVAMPPSLRNIFKELYDDVGVRRTTTDLSDWAKGIGSRYGAGIKQLAKMGPNGEIIMDYSIRDAKEAGFNKVVFIIRKDIFEEFEEIIGNRIKDQIDVEYVFQELDDLPEGFEVPEGRTKPWGTGQAVLCCKDVVKEPFVIINADDYYGKEAFVKLHDFLVSGEDLGREFTMGMAGFILKNTLSDNGTVTRGVSVVDENGLLSQVHETTGIMMGEDGKIKCDLPDVQEWISPEDKVSMNMWAAYPEFLEFLAEDFKTFLSEVEEGDLKKEYLLPNIVDKLLKEGRANVKVLETQDRWFGVTYQEDKEAVQKAFAGLIKEGVYPANLWG